MKKILNAIMIIVMVLSFLVSVPTTTQAASVAISETSRTITAKEQFRLYVKNTTEKVTWRSKDKSVAKVSKSGIVTGVRPGATTILAKVGKNTFKCKVQVIKSMSKELIALADKFANHYSSGHYINADKITIKSISKGTYKIHDGSILCGDFNYKISFSGYLADGTKQNCNLFYNSSNDFSLEFYGMDANMTNHPNYQENIISTFSSTDIANVEAMSRLIADGTYDPDADDGKIKLDTNDISLCVGNSYKFKVKNTSSKVKWSSSKPAVATVSNGTVTAKKTGTTKIKATVDGITLTATVYVIKKYSTDIQTVISAASYIRSYCAYPDDYTVTGIQLGTFPVDYENNYDSIHNHQYSEYFALIFIKAKTNSGEALDCVLGVAYNKSSVGIKNSVTSILPQGEGYSVSGDVTTCSESQVKEINALVNNGKGRLLIDY